MSELMKYGIEQAFGLDAKEVNQKLIASVVDVFGAESCGFGILNSILDELFSKLDAIDAGRSSGFRMFTTLRGDVEITQKANLLTEKVFCIITTGGRFCNAKIENSVLRIG